MKKFFKAIIAIVLVICLGVGGFFGYKFYKNKKNSSEKATEQEAEKVEIEEIEFVPVSEEDAFSQAQWMTMLNEAFQFTDYTEYNSDKINGSFAVATGFEKLGGACLDFYLVGKENTLENKCGLAVDLGLIDENYIDSYIGQEQATSLIENLKALQQSEDYHVVKNDVQLADGVIDGRDWTIDYYNYIELESTDENNADSGEEETEGEDSSEGTEESEEGANATFNEEVIASTGDYEPKIGDRIVYLDSDGIMHGGKIINSEERDGGSYDILTTPITKQADYIESYTVAGYADWSQLERLITESSDQASIAASACAKSEDITASDPMDLVLKGGIREDKVEVTEISANGIDMKEVYDTLHGEAAWHEHGEEDYNGFTGEFEIGLKDIVIYVYAKDNCSVDTEISFTPYVKLDGISGEFTIPIGDGIPLGVGIAAGEFSANIIVSADFGLEIEIAPKDPVVVSSDSNTTGSGVNTSYSDFACDVDNKVNDLIYGSSASFDDFNVQAGASMGILLKLCEVVKVASPGVDVRFVAAGQKLDKVEGYDHACWELKVAGPIVDANLSTSGDTLVDFFTQKTNTKSKWYLNSFNDDSGLLISKYYHLEYESPNPILDPEGNASVCTHYPKDEDHSKDNQIIFSIEDEGETCIDADYVIEINGERFGFEFKNEEYEEQYLAYLDHLSKEDIMGYGTTNSAFSATNYLFTISDWVWIDDDDREKLNMFSPGDLVVVNGCDISDIRIPRIMSSFGGTGFLNSGYVYGDVVGQITYDDESRFEDTIIDLGSSSFSYRRPYRNMENTEE